MPYKIKSKIWIDGKNGTFLAEGRISLMKQIIKSGSITAAAKEMKMSYKKAWEIIDGMNKEAKKTFSDESFWRKRWWWNTSD